MKMFRYIAAAALIAASGLAHTAGLSEINLTYVKSPFNLQNIVMKQQGTLEKEFDKDHIKINWHEINSGAKQSQALSAGALDIATVMNTASLLMGASAGQQISIATGVAHPRHIFAIVGKKGPKMSIEDLKGKTVAGPKGTVLHQLLVAALQSKGMTMQDVNFVSMDPAMAYTALAAGKIDAALTVAGFVIKANAAGMKTIATCEGLVEPNLVMVTRNSFAKEHPEILARIVKVQRDTLVWIRNHKKEALEMGAKAQNISITDAQKLYDWSHFYNELTDQDIKSLEKDQEFLIANGMQQKKLDVKTLVLPSAMH